MGSNCCKVSQAHQPRPKDIPIELDVREECTGKDERETTDNAKDIGKDKRDIITKALEEYLKGYKVHGKPIQPAIQDPKRKLIVKKDTKLIVAPDSTRTFLTYRASNTECQLYPAVYRTTDRVVFIYLCEDAHKHIYVACPYSHRDPTNGSKILCATVNITKALKLKEEKDHK